MFEKLVRVVVSLEMLVRELCQGPMPFLMLPCHGRSVDCDIAWESMMSAVASLMLVFGRRALNENLDTYVFHDVESSCLSYARAKDLIRSPGCCVTHGSSERSGANTSISFVPGALICIV